MGWDTRGGRGRYYTRSRRENGRVVREYIGGGEVAEIVAEMDRLTQEQRVILREMVRRQREDTSEIDRLVKEFSAGVDAVLRETLAAAGYHQHARGRWRKRRKEKTDANQEGTDQEGTDAAGAGAEKSG